MEIVDRLWFYSLPRNIYWNFSAEMEKTDENSCDLPKSNEPVFWKKT